MEYKEVLLASIQALRVNILRTLLTMLGIIIGISSVILIVSIGQGAVSFVTNELSAFGTNIFSINPGASLISATAGGSNTLTLDDADAIKNDKSLTNIDKVATVGQGSVKVSANGIDKSLLAQGVTQEMYDVIKPDITYGEFISEDNILGSEKVVVLGIDAVETFFGEDTDPTGERVKINNIPFRIIGVAEMTSVLFGGVLNNVVYIPINVMFDQILGREYVQEVDISVKDSNLMNQTIADVENLLRDRHNLKEGEENDFIIQSFQDLLSTTQTITNLLTLMVAAISAISLVVGGVGVMNIMFVSVTERTKEIGLLKAIGAKEKDILTQFLIEAVVMTLLGGIIGIALGVFGAFLISLVVGIPFVVSPLAIILAVGVSMSVGIVFGIYPAKRAADLSPIDALRYE
ncbi:MAG TPA: ABC transporter permease [Patescibacteria group bacterium]|nr:ABC transporter permease [Patescibacteria group bacterium]